MITKEELRVIAHKTAKEQKEDFKEFRKQELRRKLRDPLYWSIPIWIVWVIVLSIILVYIEQSFDISLSSLESEEDATFIQVIAGLITTGLSILLTYQTVKYLKMRKAQNNDS